jgi:hypothetical protein
MIQDLTPLATVRGRLAELPPAIPAAGWSALGHCRGQAPAHNVSAEGSP